MQTNEPSTSRMRGIISYVFIFLGGLMLIASAASKLAHVPRVVAELGGLGFKGNRLIFIATLEILSALIFLAPASRSLGLLLVSSKIRRHWIVPGLIRFNGVGDFNPHFPSRAIGETFWCSDLAFACGGNHILFVRRAPKATVPERYLLVVSSERLGVFDFEGPCWKSESTQPISVSQVKESQEAMLLMGDGDWVRSRLGVWQLRLQSSLPSGAALELVEDVVPA